MPLYPRSVANQGMCPNSFSFYCLHLWTRSSIHQKAWGCITLPFFALLFSTRCCSSRTIILHVLPLFPHCCSWCCSFHIVTFTLLLLCYSSYIATLVFLLLCYSFHVIPFALHLLCCNYVLLLSRCSYALLFSH
jgi:hypothetical protein